MTEEFSSPQPLPSKDRYENAARTQEHALGGVVEPRSSLGPRFHLDRLVEFDASAPSRHAVGPPADHSLDQRLTNTSDDDPGPDHDDTGGARERASDGPREGTDRERPYDERR